MHHAVHHLVTPLAAAITLGVALAPEALVIVPTLLLASYAERLARTLADGTGLRVAKVSGCRGRTDDGPRRLKRQAQRGQQRVGRLRFAWCTIQFYCALLLVEPTRK